MTIFSHLFTSGATGVNSAFPLTFVFAAKSQKFLSANDVKLTEPFLKLKSVKTAKWKLRGEKYVGNPYANLGDTEMPDLFSLLESKVRNGECTWQEILSEINAIKNENTTVDYLTLIRSGKDVELLNDETMNQHRLYARKQMFQQLSRDARKMAKVIILCMNGHRKFEYLESELIHKDKVAKTRIYHVMKKHFRWTVRRVKKVFNELSNYCNELSRME